MSNFAKYKRLGRIVRITLVALVVGMFCGSSIPNAQARFRLNRAVYVALQSGMFLPIGDTQQGTQWAIGGTIGYRTLAGWALGIYVLHSSQTITIVNTTATSASTLFGPEFGYFFQEEANPHALILMGKTGFIYRNIGSNSNVLGLPITESSSSFDLLLGLKVGYEYSVSSHLGVGAEFNVLLDLFNSKTAPSSLLGLVTYWF